MKRVSTVAFSLLIFSCLLLANTGLIQAINLDYQVAEAYDTTPVTLDGNWAAGEWDDSWIEYLNYSANGERFCYKANDDIAYAPEILIDSADTTNDTGDIWQICIGVPGDQTTPQAGQNKIEIVGHENLTVYEGNGSGWDQIASSSVTWADAMTVHTAPLDFDHWCVEIIIDKTAIGSAAWNGAPPIGLRVAMYDATNATWLAWPPASDANIPDSWGQISGGNPTIPESLSFAAVVLLSSIAVAVTFYFLRKRPKTKNYISGRTGEINYTN